MHGARFICSPPPGATEPTPANLSPLKQHHDDVRAMHVLSFYHLYEMERRAGLFKFKEKESSEAKLIDRATVPQ